MGCIPVIPSFTTPRSVRIASRVEAEQRSRDTTRPPLQPGGGTWAESASYSSRIVRCFSISSGTWLH